MTNYLCIALKLWENKWLKSFFFRRYSLDGIPLRPTWLPLVSILSAEDRIDFNLLLTTGNNAPPLAFIFFYQLTLGKCNMCFWSFDCFYVLKINKLVIFCIYPIITADWHYKREEYVYFLGDPLHFEVSAVVRDHTPLRVFVDHCAATATPDAEASLRYDFIENFGSVHLEERSTNLFSQPNWLPLLCSFFFLTNGYRCLADAYLTNSSSHFLPRVKEDRLRFQVDAFRFHHESSNQVPHCILSESQYASCFFSKKGDCIQPPKLFWTQVYVTCYVKAVPVTLPVSSQNRACSLIDNRYISGRAF